MTTLNLPYCLDTEARSAARTRIGAVGCATEMAGNGSSALLQRPATVRAQAAARQGRRACSELLGQAYRGYEFM